MISNTLLEWKNGLATSHLAVNDARESVWLGASGFQSMRSIFLLVFTLYLVVVTGDLCALEIYPGPGVSTYKSNLYTVDVHDGSAWFESYTYKCSRRSVMGTWYGNQYPSVNFTTFGTSNPISVKVTRPSGEITSIKISPKAMNIDVTIVGGQALFSLMPYDKVWIVANGDEANPLFISADPPKPSVPAGATYFGPGIHDIGQLYKPANDSVLYLDGGAWVKGNIDIRGRNNVRIMGPGVLSGEKWASESLYGLSWEQQKNYFMIAGNMDNPLDEFISNTIEGITIVLSPMYNTFGGLSHIDNVKLFSPWHWSTDGFYVAPRPGGDVVIEHCLAFIGDDVFFPRESDRGNTLIRNCFVSTTGNNVFQMSYWAFPLNHSHGCLVSNVDIKTYNQGAVFQAQPQNLWVVFGSGRSPNWW